MNTPVSIIIPEIEQSIAVTPLGHEHQTLLLGFLRQFSSTEQQDLLALAGVDKNFWTKLAVRVLMVQHELTNGSTEVIEKECVDATRVLKHALHS
jgi:hypothetical protein